MNKFLIKFKQQFARAGMLLVVLVLFGFGLSLATTHTSAAINTQLNYQGKLTNASGIAVDNDTYNMKFVIYDGSGVSATCLWTSVGACDTSDYGTTTVTTVSGVFSTQLGGTGHNSLATSSIDWNTNSLYLGVTVRGAVGSPVYDAEMTPRKRLTSSPYAFNADLVDGIEAASTPTANALLALDSQSNFDLLGQGVSSTRATTTNLYVNGAAGIGTTTPSTTLSVIGSSWFGDATSNGVSIDSDGDLYLQGTADYIVGTASTDDYAFRWGGDEDYGLEFVAADGYTFNTGDGSSIFTIYGLTGNASTTGNFSIGKSLGTQSLGEGDLFVGAQATITDSLTVDSTLYVTNGNTGIGDSSPASLFTVGNGELFTIDSSGNASTTGYLNIGNNAGLTLGAGDLFVGSDATITNNLTVSGYASTTNLVFSDSGSDFGGAPDLYVSSGNLYFDGSILTAGATGLSKWQYAFDKALTATSTDIGLYVTASSTFSGGLRVDSNATTTGSFATNEIINAANDAAATTTVSTNLSVSQGYDLQVETIYAYSPLNIRTGTYTYGNATTTGWLNIGTTDVVGTFGAQVGAGDLYNSGNATTSGNLTVGGFASSTSIVTSGTLKAVGASTLEGAVSGTGFDSSVNTLTDARITGTWRAAVNGLASLGADGKVPNSQLSPLAIGTTFVVASEAAMLALSSAETGDVAVRTDLNKSYILNGTYSTLGDWIELLTPTDGVISVNGEVGAVTLTTNEIAEASNLYYTDARVDTYIDTLAGAVNGLASLDGSGKVPTSQLPSLTLNDTFVVADQTARLALSAAVGDIAVQEDTSETYILASLPASTNGNWVLLLNAASVTSVNGNTGAVTLTTSDIAEGSNLYWTTTRFDDRLVATTTWYGDLWAKTGNIGANIDPSYPLEVQGVASTSDNLYVGQDLYVGHSDGSDSDTIFFDMGAESLVWNNTNTQFEVSDDLVISGSSTTTGNIMIGGNASTTGYVSIGTAINNLALASGDLFVSNNATTTNYFEVGAVTSAGAGYAAGDLNVGNDISIDGNASFVANDILIDSTGVDVATGDAYFINNTSVLNATTLGSAVVSSSLTSVGALSSGSIASGFGAIDNGTSNITSGGIWTIDVDGTDIAAAGSLNFGAANDAALYWDGTNLVAETTNGLVVQTGAGSDLFVIDSSGNASTTGYFNIGTGLDGWTPAAGDLFVSGNATTTGSHNFGAGGAGDSVINFYDNDVLAYTLGNDDSSNLFTISNGNGFESGTLFTLDSSGNASTTGYLNVGTTNPTGPIGAGDLFVGAQATITDSLAVDSTLYVTNSLVGIGIAAPTEALDILGNIRLGSADVVAPNGNSDELEIHNDSTYAGISILSDTGGILDFGDSLDDNVGRIIYTHSSNQMQFKTSGANQLALSSTGLTITADLDIDGNDLTSAGDLTITAGGDDVIIPSGDRLTIGTTTAQTGYGLYVEDSGTAPAGFNRTTDDGVIISLMQAGAEEGTISVSGTTVSYNAFTGSHYALTDEEIARGQVVALTGEVTKKHNLDHSEPFYGIEISSTENSNAILGSFLSLQTPSQPQSIDNPNLVMAVGNGDMWITDNGSGDIRIGDYLITSAVAGHAERDTKKHDISYVIARASENFSWDDVTEDLNGTKHHKTTVFFENFIVDNRVDQLVAAIELLQGASLLDEAILDGDDSGEELVVDPSGALIAEQDLIVRGNSEFHGTLYVRGEAGFEHKVVFKDDVEIQGKLYVSTDQAGTATIEANATSTEVLFEGEYEFVPKVIANLTADTNEETFVNWKVIRKNKNGFRILIEKTSEESLTFDWIALANTDGIATSIGLAPVIDELTTSHQTVGTEVAVELWAKVTDEDTDESELTYSWNIAPDLGNIDGDSGLVYWTVSDSETISENTTVAITATVSDGSSVTSESIEVTVLSNTDEEPEPPVEENPEPEPKTPTTTPEIILEPAPKPETSTSTPEIIEPDPEPEPELVLGCTDDTALNFDELATQDNGLCEYEPEEEVVVEEEATTEEEVVIATEEVVEEEAPTEA